MALDGIVRMVDVFFRHWDDAKKMWSEQERGGFRLVVIGDELPLYPHRAASRCIQVSRTSWPAAVSFAGPCIA